MSLNADNIFVRCSDATEVLEQLSTLSNRKLVASKVSDGWVQVIAAGEVTPPDVAQKLSALIQGDVVCVQLYESSGDAGWGLYRGGVEVERFHSNSVADPAGAASRALKQFGVPFQVRLFRELVTAKDQGVKIRASAAQQTR